MDRLAAMRAFVTIVDEGSLTRAAAVLDRAPPTMVRTLAALEEELGVRLLVRTTRQMSLTEEGRVYLDRCRRILLAVEEAEQAVGAGDSEPGGPIRMTAPVLFGQRHIAPAVVEFIKRHPKIHVDLLLLDRVVHLVEEGLDVGLRIGRLEDSSMIAVPVGTMRRVFVASPELLARLGRPAHPSEFGDLPCVLHHGSAPSGSWSYRDPARERQRTLKVSLNDVFASNQALAVVEACRSGLGFGYFLSYQVEPEVRSGKLEILFADFETAPLPVQIVYPDARLMSPRLRVFIDWLKQELRSRPEIRDRSQLPEGA
jgi:DNA-binding transcriptional LysR family regulator